MNGLRLVGLVGEPPSIPRMFPERIFVKKSLGRRLKKLADRIICFSKACIKRKDFFLWKNFHGIWTHSQSPLSRPPLLVEVGGSVQEDRGRRSDFQGEGGILRFERGQGFGSIERSFADIPNRASKCLVRMEDFRTLEENRDLQG